MRKRKYSDIDKRNSLQVFAPGKLFWLKIHINFTPIRIDMYLGIYCFRCRVLLNTEGPKTATFLPICKKFPLFDFKN